VEMLLKVLVYHRHVNLIHGIEGFLVVTILVVVQYNQMRFLSLPFNRLEIPIPLRYHQIMGKPTTMSNICTIRQEREIYRVEDFSQGYNQMKCQELLSFLLRCLQMRNENVSYQRSPRSRVRRLVQWVYKGCSLLLFQGLWTQRFPILLIILVYLALARVLLNLALIFPLDLPFPILLQNLHMLLHSMGVKLAIGNDSEGFSQVYDQRKHQ
ncbi:MAG: hypothetical protein ACJ788_22805, partial [Ktedonobacteraceae bacterium]